MASPFLIVSQNLICSFFSNWENSCLWAQHQWIAKKIIIWVTYQRSGGGLGAGGRLKLLLLILHHADVPSTVLTELMLSVTYQRSWSLRALLFFCFNSSVRKVWLCVSLFKCKKRPLRRVHHCFLVNSLCYYLFGCFCAYMYSSMPWPQGTKGKWHDLTAVKVCCWLLPGCSCCVLCDCVHCLCGFLQSTFMVFCTWFVFVVAPCYL